MSKTIYIADMIKLLDTKEPADLTFITQKGDVKKVKGAVQAGYITYAELNGIKKENKEGDNQLYDDRHNPNHYANGTRNLIVPNMPHPVKVCIWFITYINGLKVIA